ncbi:MAG: ferrous iron transport protein B [Bacteroidetes bacterium HGW-Bacteroidetes-6]|jgi:ferrous iron transport protein B|nr:MAG: ferrous iron transport protein B [Bacteroidetes bacterium HGW-Bacteroidetes-6]
MTLNELQPGQTGFVVKIRGRGAFRKRVIEMGFTSGRKIEVIRKAPLQDPIEYRLMDYEISLRRSEARFIEVITLDEISQEHKEEAVESSNSSVLFTEEYIEKKIIQRSREIDIALVGNPNCGKTTLFNFASGSTEHVGNYSGVTVEAKTGSFHYKGFKINLIDLPGTYSLSAYSPEELFVRRQLISTPPDFIVNVVDASNLERNLFLTTQLMELDIPTVVALNMFDELLAKGDKFDYQLLGNMLGIPFQPTVGHRNKGVDELLDIIIERYKNQSSLNRKSCIRFPMEMEEAVEKLRLVIEDTKFVKENVSSRFYAIKLLEKDKQAVQAASHKEFLAVLEKSEAEIGRIEAFYSDDAENLVADARYGFIAGALKETYVHGTKPRNFKSFTQRLDKVLTHRLLGFPIFLLFLWLMFFSTFFLGSFPMSWMEQGVAFIGNLISQFIPNGLLKDLLVDGIISGVGGVMVFLPNILILFFFIALMEDTGYMARIAFLMDKIMHRIGLHGKSFIPMVMGFGCNVPAIMATRTLENPSDRLLTILINPFMSCSARLPVYILIIGTVFPTHAVAMLFLVYIIGIFFAVIFSILFKKTMFRKSEAPFVMELPPYRMPTSRVLFRHMWFRASQYLKKMGGIILVASIIIWALGNFPRNFSPDPQLQAKIFSLQKDAASMVNPGIVPVGHKNLNIRYHEVVTDYAAQKQLNSYIGRIGNMLQPVMAPLGFDWRLTVSLIAGITAKEVVVSTMAVLFAGEHPDNTNRINNIRSSADNSLSGNLKSAKFKNRDNQSAKLMTPLTGFAFLMFVLLYFPCIAVVAAIRKETGGWKWALFTVAYTTMIAWLVAFSVVKIGGLFL